MPAINLSRLKKQAAQVAESFGNPNKLESDLKNLFEFYADRTHRPRKSGNPEAVIPAYKVPKSVIDRVLFELREFVEADAAAALEIADRFWVHRYLEFRLLAAGILKAAPLDEPQEVVKRLIKWGESCEEEVLKQLLAEFSVERLQREAREEYLNLLEFWLSSRQQLNQELGLRALNVFLKETDFRELPTVYRLLAPHVQETSSKLRPYVLETVRLLAQISPNETAYYLRKRLDEKKTPTNTWLTRRSRAVFPEDLRATLKSLTE